MVIPLGGPDRRSAILRWVRNLTPLIVVITREIAELGLGDPELPVGPTFLDAGRFTDARNRIRLGGVWFVDGVNTGYHVDFMADRTEYATWSAGRRNTLTVTGEATDRSVADDLRTALRAGGLLREQTEDAS